MAHQVDTLVKTGKEDFAFLDEMWGRKKQQHLQRLVKMGKEDFALLDEMCGRKKQPHHKNDKAYGRLVYLRPNVVNSTVRQPDTDSNLEAQL